MPHVQIMFETYQSQNQNSVYHESNYLKDPSIWQPG